MEELQNKFELLKKNQNVISEKKEVDRSTSKRRISLIEEILPPKKTRAKKWRRVRRLNNKKWRRFRRREDHQDLPKERRGYR